MEFNGVMRWFRQRTGASDAHQANRTVVAMNAVPICEIEMDLAIQCRATIDAGTVNEYADRMSESDQFPPVDLFGNTGRYWIGDGWHRVMACQQIGALSIGAVVHEGGRLEALKHALGANAAHGHRRTNADKRRCVEIALREFANMSSRVIAEMCGVSNVFVSGIRPEVLTVNTSTGADGKQYPARRAVPVDTNSAATIVEAPSLRPPSLGMQFARMAIIDLQQIRRDDSERAEAFSTIRRWLDENEA